MTLDFTNVEVVQVLIALDRYAEDLGASEDQANHTRGAIVAELADELFDRLLDAGVDPETDPLEQEEEG